MHRLSCPASASDEEVMNLSSLSELKRSSRGRRRASDGGAAGGRSSRRRGRTPRSATTPRFVVRRCAVLLPSLLLTITGWNRGSSSCIWIVSAQPQRYGTGADAAGDEFVRQVLEEEASHYGDRPDPYATDEQIQAQKDAEERRRIEQERTRQAEQQRLAQEEADRVRRQREDAFEREVSEMNEQQAKKARQKKKRDAKVVQKILRAAAREDHYSVLGLRNWDVRIPPRSFGVGKWSVRFPGLRLFHASPKDIRKAYRKLSVLVHPDRNRDGRANEGFVALENAASILSDEKLRNEYDEHRRALRDRRQKQATQAVSKTVNTLWATTSRTVAVFRTVLGPFAFPVAVLGSLIV